MRFFSTVYRFTPGALLSGLLLAIVAAVCAVALLLLEHPEVIP